MKTGNFPLLTRFSSESLVNICKLTDDFRIGENPASHQNEQAKKFFA